MWNPEAVVMEQQRGRVMEALSTAKHACAEAALNGKTEIFNP